MTALQRVQAAIEKLEKLRDASGTDEWHQGRHYIDAGGVPSDPDREVASFLSIDDTSLVFTLHRTIDAQLRVLAYGATVVGGDIPEAIVNLADAILGGDS